MGIALVYERSILIELLTPPDARELGGFAKGDMNPAVTSGLVVGEEYYAC